MKEKDMKEEEVELIGNMTASTVALMTSGLKNCDGILPATHPPREMTATQLETWQGVSWYTLFVPFWSPVPLWYHFLHPSILFQKNLRAI